VSPADVEVKLALDLISDRSRALSRGIEDRQLPSELASTDDAVLAELEQLVFLSTMARDLVGARVAIRGARRP
jgi:hypothetical protein